MKLATDRQKNRMTELGIEFDAEMEMDEAAEILREHLKPVAVKFTLNENSLMERSEPDGDQ